MKCYSVIVYLLYFVVYTYAVDVQPGGWKAHHSTDDLVDPSGWNYDRTSKSIKRPRFEEPHAISCSTYLNVCRQDVKEYCSASRDCKEAPTCKTEVKVMKRFINLLLKSAHLSSFRVAQGGPTSGLVDIRVTEEDLQILEWFGDSGHEVSWHQLDTAMTRVINSGLHMSKEYFTWMDNILYFLGRREVWLWAAAFFMTMFVLWLLLNGHPFTGACTIVSVVIFMFSYVMEFYRMFKEAEIEQLVILKQHSEIPLACRPGDMTWYQMLWNSISSAYQFRSDECQKYYSALMIDPMTMVSPTRVLSNIMADFVLAPAKKMGEAIAAFTAGVMSNLPGAWGWIILVISFGAVFLIVLLVVLRLLGSRIRFTNILFGIEIGADTRQIRDSSRSATAIEGSSHHHPLLEAYNKSPRGNLVLMDASSLKELITPSSTQNSTENPLDFNILLHRNPIDNISSPQKSCGTMAGTSNSAGVSQNVDHPAAEVETKEKSTVSQQALDVSGDDIKGSCSPEKSYRASEGTSKLAICSRNVYCSADDEAKDRKNVNQQALDGSGDTVKSNGASEGTSESAVCSQNIERSAVAEEKKEKKNIHQQALDGSGDANKSSCSPEGNYGTFESAVCSQNVEHSPAEEEKKEKNIYQRALNGSGDTNKSSCSPEGDCGEPERTSESAFCSQNVEHSPAEEEKKEKKNIQQQAVDGSGDANKSSCSPEGNYGASESAVCSQNVERSPAEEEKKEKNIYQRALDGSRDTVSYIAEPDTS